MSSALGPVGNASDIGFRLFSHTDVYANLLQEGQEGWDDCGLLAPEVCRTVVPCRFAPT